MQECGYVNVTPENVGEQDPYEIQAALMFLDIDNDPGLKKARDYMQQRRTKNPRPKGKRGPGVNHLHAVK